MKTRTIYAGRIGLVVLTALALAMTMTLAGLFVYAETEDQKEHEVTEVKSASVSDLPGEKVLLQGYMDQEVEDAQNSGQTKRPAYSRYSRLNNAGKAIYDKLDKQIALIASGKRESTEITIAVSDLNLDQTPTCTVEEGHELLLEKAGIDPATILRALMSDKPYEMYWFDKKSGYAVGYRYLQSSGGFSLSSVTYYFSVAASYRKGQVEDYTADTKKTGAVGSSIEQVSTIIDNNKNKSDVDKIENYALAVMDLVTYDHDSVDAEDYGDPWQLVYVFDGNKGTNVVCEGYAKAFKYLCDLSDFRDSSIGCETVTGYLVQATVDGGSSTGAHMWNVVHIGEKNYLADVTTADAVYEKLEGVLWKNAVMAGAEYYSDNDLYLIRIDAQNSAGFVYDNVTKALFDSNEILLSQTSYRDDLASGNGGGNEGDDPGTGSGTDPGNTGGGNEGGDPGAGNSGGTGGNENTGSTGAGNGTGGSTGTVNRSDVIPGGGGNSGNNNTASTTGGRVATSTATQKPTAKTDSTVSTAEQNKSKKATKKTVVKSETAKKVTTKKNYKPGKVTISKATKGKKRITIKWKRVKSNTKGYQIKLTDKKTKKTKTIKVKQGKKKTLSKVVKGLKSKRKYTVKIRAYNKVAGKMYYGKWSKAKTVAVK